LKRTPFVLALDATSRVIRLASLYCCTRGIPVTVACKTLTSILSSHSLVAPFGAACECRSCHQQTQNTRLLLSSNATFP